MAPIAYGVSNRLMLQSHPILDLLLVPLGGDAVALFRKDGVLLHRPPITIAAREARLEADGGALRLRLAGGELHVGTITRAPLGALDTTIDLRAVISPHLRFLEDAAETAPLWAPALALSGATVALAAPLAPLAARGGVALALAAVYALGAPRGPAPPLLLALGACALLTGRRKSRRSR